MHSNLCVKIHNYRGLAEQLFAIKCVMSHTRNMSPTKLLLERSQPFQESRARITRWKLWDRPNVLFPFLRTSDTTWTWLIPGHTDTTQTILIFKTYNRYIWFYLFTILSIILALYTVKYLTIDRVILYNNLLTFCIKKSVNECVFNMVFIV